MIVNVCLPLKQLLVYVIREKTSMCFVAKDREEAQEISWLSQHLVKMQSIKTWVLPRNVCGRDAITVLSENDAINSKLSTMITGLQELLSCIPSQCFCMLLL